MRAAVSVAFLLIVLALAGCAEEETPTPDPMPAETDLDAIAKDAEESRKNEVSASGNGTEDSQTATAVANGTSEQETFIPLMDTLLEGNYVVAPANIEPVFTYSFEVAEEYDTLEAVGAYPDGDQGMVRAYAVKLNFTITSPSGDAVIHYAGNPDFFGVDAMAKVEGYPGTGTGGSLYSMPLGYHFQPEQGTYTVSISGGGSSTFDLKVTGYKGLAPDFEYRLLGAEETRMLSDSHGRVVVVDLMATWCGPCAKAMPELVALKQEYGDLIEILSIDIDEEETDDQLQAFKEEHNGTWTFGFDLGDAYTKYGTGWIPTFAIVDQQGGLLYRQIGAMDPAKCREIIDHALETR